MCRLFFDTISACSQGQLEVRDGQVGILHFCKGFPIWFEVFPLTEILYDRSVLYELKGHHVSLRESISRIHMGLLNEKKERTRRHS